MRDGHGLEAESEVAARAQGDVTMEPPPMIGGDERRMHVRAYNYWVSLLDGRQCPSITKLDPASLGDFGPNSVLLDFRADPADAADPPGWVTPCAKRARCPRRCARSRTCRTRSLLSRLTDHYLQIMANRAPIGFEAEFVNARGNYALYRGILMPFSSDNRTIDYIYGVINWKELADPSTAAEIVAAARAVLADDAACHPPRPERPSSGRTGRAAA